MEENTTKTEDNTSRFKDGTIIFKEGDKSDAAYIITSGSIALTKEGSDGPIDLALLQEGEIFGEMGIFDEEARSATAFAMGDVELLVIPKDKFIEMIDSNTSIAVKIINKLVSRLRNTDEMLAQKPQIVTVDAKGQPARSSVVVTDVSSAVTVKDFFWRFFSQYIKKPKTAKPKAQPKKNGFVILVSKFYGSGSEAARDRLLSSLVKIPGVQIRSLETVLTLDEGNNEKLSFSSAVIAAKSILEEERADLLIWGGAKEKRLTRIHFTNRSLDNDRDHANIFTNTLSDSFPVSILEKNDELIKAVVFGSLMPETTEQAKLVMSILPNALKESETLGTHPSVEMSKMDQIAVMMRYANALITAGRFSSDASFSEKAANIYKVVLDRLPRDADEAYVVVNRQLGIVYQSDIDRGDISSEVYRRALSSLKEALDGVVRHHSPLEWAALHFRLGEVYYKKGLEHGDNESLKNALSAFQDALKVYIRSEYPYRWAETIDSMAATLAVYGEHAKNEEMLERAISLSRSVFYVRDKVETPLSWAESKNTLATALFLLAKQNSSLPLIKESAGCYKDALKVYKKFGMEKQAKTAEKNLFRAENLYSEKSR